ncbi:Inner membrane transport permease ybhS [Chlamydia abortus]|nr:Inner membrane transport permease ybhS [Chlamydia abortus]
MNSLYIAANIVKRTIGKGKSLLVFLALPALVVSLVVVLLGNSGQQVQVAYANLDQGPLGERLINALQASTGYSFVEAEDTEALRLQVIDKKSVAGLFIPEGYSSKLTSGETPRVEWFELGVSESGIVLKQKLNEQIRGMTGTYRLLSSQIPNSAEAEAALLQVLSEQQKNKVRAVVENSGLAVNEAVSTSMGMLIMFVMMLVNNSISTILDDRTNRTMQRMYAAPVRSYQIMAGNFLGSLFLGTVQILLILLFARYVLRFSFGMPLLQQWLVMECFLLAALGISLAVAGLVRNRNNVATVQTLIVTPTCMLGGCYWPVDIMPEYMQKAANIVPQKWAIEAINRLAAGDGLSQVVLHLGILGLFAVILLGFGAAVLRPSETETA